MQSPRFLSVFTIIQRLRNLYDASREYFLGLLSGSQVGMGSNEGVCVVQVTEVFTEASQ